MTLVWLIFDIYLLIKLPIVVKRYYGDYKTLRKSSEEGDQIAQFIYFIHALILSIFVYDFFNYIKQYH